MGWMQESPFFCCGPVKGPEERRKLGIMWNKYIEWKHKYSIGKKSVEHQSDCQSVRLDLTYHQDEYSPSIYSIRKSSL